MKQKYDRVSDKCSQLITTFYSTSFSLGVKLLHPSLQKPIYSIYGFVRLADEIVDSFTAYPKDQLLDEFIESYYQAIATGISLNPVINSFQHTVKKYQISNDLIQAFFKSMRMDLSKTHYTEKEYREYIYGSADAVGLMCLQVFLNRDMKRYEELKPYAVRLGSAFQKVNFLRDLKSDIQELHRIYFPVLQNQQLNDQSKREIIREINEDFDIAIKGIRKLPNTAKLGVYTAYFYYRHLLYKIERLPTQIILQKRIRISNARKLALAAFTRLSFQLRLI